MLAAADASRTWRRSSSATLRYADAMAESGRPEQALKKIRSSIEMQRRTRHGWLLGKGLADPPEALEVARRRLSEVRAPEHRTRPKTAVATRHPPSAVAARRNMLRGCVERRGPTLRDRAAREPAAPAERRVMVLRLELPGACCPPPSSTWAPSVIS